LRFLSQVLFGRSRPLWQHCLLAFPIAVIPSLSLIAFVYALVMALGLSADLLKPPNVEPTLWELVGTVLFAPLVETLLLAGVLRLLSMLSANTPFIAAVSGLLWGALHATRAVLWFFGTAWSFFVFSCLYLAWRRVSFKHAYVAALVPHMLINITVMGSVFLMESPNPSIERASSSKLRLLPVAAHVKR